MMKKLTQLVAILGIVAFLGLEASAAHLSARILFSARMNGANITPTPVNTNATGVASLMLNATRDSLDINISTTGLSGAITGIHIHEGDALTNGDVRLDLTGNVLNNVCRTRIALAQLPAGFITNLLTANAYIAVHTATNPGGEIRGQIKLEADFNYVARLDTAQQNAPVAGGAAVGLASLNISLDGKRLEVNLASLGLSGDITGLHLHKGALGTDGGLLVDLTTLIKGRTATGTIAIPDSLGGGLLDRYIRQGLVYLNAHTTANAGGEIRGQLAFSSALAMDAKIDTFQITGSVAGANPFGVAVFTFSDDFKSFTFESLISGTSDSVVAAHFHNGARMADGPVSLEIPIAPGSNGFELFGVYNASNGLTDGLVTEFLKENMYIAFHTKANPNGEARGQVSRLAREGFVTEIDAQQIVGTTTGTGLGGGMVSIGRGRNDAHYMITVDGLTGPLQAAHFHKGVKGANGDVIFEIPFVNNGAFGYWTAASTPAMTPANELQFRRDSVYVAFHTTANAGGELRGQLIRDYRANVIIVGIDENNIYANAVATYPNPTNSVLNFNSTVDLNGSQVILVDMMGKKVLETTFNNQIDISNVNAGLYLLNIQTDKGIVYSTKINKL